MQAVIRRAVGLRERCGVAGIASERDVRRMADALGVEVVDDWGFRSPRQRAMHVDGGVYLCAGLSEGWRTALLAHELGHAVLHRGNHLYLAVPMTEQLRDLQEREAHVYGGVLIIGKPTARTAGRRLKTAHDRDGVPADFWFRYLYSLHYQP